MKKTKQGKNQNQAGRPAASRRMFLFLAAFLMCGLSATFAQERGIASYYSHNLHGSKMSNGQRYHRDSMTCAHKKHPFGTLLKVTAVKTGKSVIVKVTDRGPFGRGRIVDLSYAAARQLGIVKQGIAQVEVTVYKGEAPGQDDKKTATDSSSVAAPPKKQ